MKTQLEIEQIMIERFGTDSIIALATTVDNVPFVRNVDAFYENGSFYILTHAFSTKMKQIEKNNLVAISGEWFTAHGKAVNKGYFGNPENKEVADKMRKYFSEWIDNGHNDFSDINTIVLAVELTDGILYVNGMRYEIDFKILR